MTFLLVLILLVLVFGFGFGWLRGALRAICMVGAGAVALGLLVRAFEVSPSTILYVGLAVVGVGGFLADRFMRRFGNYEAVRKVREARKS